ncbi:hypothetical protein KBG31_02330 [Patescibacteria group bacterium]|nr:hypothetical protein [Patescibacteria group bacterium]HOM77904.1 hypothetical protein [bacterium]
MEFKPNINDTKKVEKIADNLEGVSFSQGDELGKAVSDVSLEKGFLARIKKLFNTVSTKSKKIAQ